MISKVVVQTPYGSYIDLPLFDDGNGLVVESIDGLDPVKATLVSTGFAQMDGKEYQSSSFDIRNIKFKIGIYPDYANDTVQDVRNRLYKFMMPKSAVLLAFEMDTGEVYKISGRVESFESATFSPDPSVDISVVCFNPSFYDPSPEVILGQTAATSQEEVLVNYDGTVETGIKFTLNVDRNMSEFTIYHLSSEQQYTSMTFRKDLVAGDVVVISTNPGNKYVMLTHLTGTNSALYGMSPDSVWTLLTPGTNKLYVYASGEPIPFSIEYTKKFGAI